MGNGASKSKNSEKSSNSDYHPDQVSIPSESTSHSASKTNNSNKETVDKTPVIKATPSKSSNNTPTKGQSSNNTPTKGQSSNNTPIKSQSSNTTPVKNQKSEILHQSADRHTHMYHNLISENKQKASKTAETMDKNRILSGKLQRNRSSTSSTESKTSIPKAVHATSHKPSTTTVSEQPRHHISTKTVSTTGHPSKSSSTHVSGSGAVKSQKSRQAVQAEVEDIVFETFYHRDGREFECMYLSGQRYYLDSWVSKEWQPFPRMWYNNGFLVTNSIIKEQEEEPVVAYHGRSGETTTAAGLSTGNRSARRSSHKMEVAADDRVGFIKHPKRGRVSTYIFEERHNVHYFFDDNTGTWARLPLSWELLHTQVQKMVEKVQESIPDWKDQWDILALLRVCDYNPDECISNYMLTVGEGVSSTRSLHDVKTIMDKEDKIHNIEHHVKELEVQLSAEKGAKKEAENMVQELQDRISSLEAEARNANAQLESLHHARPKTAPHRPKTPQQVVHVSKIKDEDIAELNESAKELTKVHVQLRMEIHRWVTDMNRTIKSAVSTASELKDLDEQTTAEIEDVRALYRKEVTQRKVLYNQLQELRGNIRVFCRCRKDERVRCCLTFPSDQDIMLTMANGTKKQFQFDRVFAPGGTQDQVFEDTLPVITSCVDGYDVCILAYGQTGSGKTFTMMGPNDNPGVNVRAVKELFRLCKDRSETQTYTIKIAILEIYNETVHDLLNKEAKVIEVRSQGNKVTLPGLSEMDVQSLDDIQTVMDLGDQNRSVASTKMNSTSSRSHLLMMVRVVGIDKVTGAVSSGVLTLCDLAGSERISKTEAQGQRLVEAAAINKSLSALGQVFSALRSKQLHVPYRNSKLTLLLQPSLGGDSKAALFVNISPDVYNLMETSSTLQFGSNARQVALGQAKQNISKKAEVES